MRQSARLYLIAVVLAVCAVSSTAQTVNAVFTVSNFVGSAVSVNRMTVMPFLPGPAYHGGFLSPYIPAFTRANSPSLTNGTVTVSNLMMDFAYTVNISDGYSNIVAQIFPDSRLIGTNATINAANYVSRNVNPNGPYAIPYLPSFSCAVVSNVSYLIGVGATNVVFTNVPSFVVGQTLYENTNYDGCGAAAAVLATVQGWFTNGVTPINLQDGYGLPWSALVGVPAFGSAAFSNATAFYPAGNPSGFITSSALGGLLATNGNGGALTNLNIAGNGGLTNKPSSFAGTVTVSGSLSITPSVGASGATNYVISFTATTNWPAGSITNAPWLTNEPVANALAISAVTNTVGTQWVAAFSAGTNAYYCSNCPVSSWNGVYYYAGTLSLPPTNSGTVVGVSFPYYSKSPTNYLINLSNGNDGAEQVMQTNAVLYAALAWNGSAFVWIANASGAAFDAQGVSSMADGSWFNDISQSSAPGMAVYGSVLGVIPGLTTNLQFTFGSTRTNTMCFTNGILMRVTQP